ncbi:MAG: serine/threonine protein kinase [Lachnospiraceae bacterium]|nr:serine/threonine protein kinase [Lachnospiraceae bacterium]
MLFKGQVLRDRYRIERRIGSGGSSNVYLATDISIGKKWAVKYLDCNDDTMWLAQNEINMMIRLDHAMFPRIVDAWQEAGGYVIVSDYVEGITLDRVLRGGRTFGRRTLVSWWLDIAEAIRYLHDLKPSILYLDLKLENIMLKKDGSLKLIDFGIAGRIADRGSLYGTPGYAAPEQYYNRGELLDERTDVFAFGMLMYAMYTGRRPAEDLKRQEALIRDDKRLPAAIKRIILGCIGEDKSQRFSDMHVLLGALDDLRGVRAGMMRIKLAAAAVVLLMGVFGAAAIKYVVAEQVDDAAKRMMSELEGHISDGEYTEEGIRIICGYIEAGCLDEETCKRFTYEVARNYFSVRRNYREALRYYEMLDPDEFPEAGYCMQLCRLQISFEEDEKQYIKCLEEFVGYNRGLGYGQVRYENDLMIANLYAALPGDEGREAAFKQLESGLGDLRYAVREGLYTDTDSGYEAEYYRRLCILCSERGDKDGTKKYGEEALMLLNDKQGVKKDDIKRIMDSMR